MKPEPRVNVAIHKTPHSVALVAAVLDEKKSLIEFMDAAVLERAERFGITPQTLTALHRRKSK